MISSGERKLFKPVHKYLWIFTLLVETYSYSLIFHFPAFGIYTLYLKPDVKYFFIIKIHLLLNTCNYEVEGVYFLLWEKFLTSGACVHTPYLEFPHLPPSKWLQNFLFLVQRDYIQCEYPQPPPLSPQPELWPSSCTPVRICWIKKKVFEQLKILYTDKQNLLQSCKTVYTRIPRESFSPLYF